MEQRGNEKEITMQELVALINATDGDFYYAIELREEASHGEKDDTHDRSK